MYNKVTEFEKKIAEFYNAPYAVATDCCTHAIELSLIHSGADSVGCPLFTYISIPFTFEKLKLTWNFYNERWQDYYYIKNTNIVDAAVYWKKGGYIPGTYMCLSFQFRKHLNLFRGGAILVDDRTVYDELKSLSHDGRYGQDNWASMNISSVGYHYYMTPETAQLGLEKLPDAIEKIPTSWSWLDYPNLSSMEVFKK